MGKIKHLLPIVLLSILFFQCSAPPAPTVPIKKGDHIVLIGNNLCSRMMYFGSFETELQLRFPDSLLFIRNMCDGGNTPGFRPHAGKFSPWAYPGAEKYQTELANFSDSQGHFESPDEWLTRLKADIILAFFGYNESFEGEKGLENFKLELEAFIRHTLKQKYNGGSASQLVLVSPIAFENLSDKMDLPVGQTENVNLSLYANAIKEIATKNEILFVDAFTLTKKWFAENDQLTIDGSQLNEQGYSKFSKLLVDRIFGGTPKAKQHRKLVHEAVLDKNWFWYNDFKIPNGVHVFGRRYEPFGVDNYPEELAKIREITALRDQAIWAALKGEKIDTEKADQQTRSLPQVKTNYSIADKNDAPKYLYGTDALNSFKLAPGYKIELFASEKEFPDLANPVQMSFDNKGRLWVAVMPSYPHYKPGDERPNDKLIILEDLDGDGKADQQKTFTDGLHLPLGFELAPEGVYLSQSTNFIMLTDTDGDDKADKKELLLSGFDNHDSHHGISAFCADPGGSIYMAEGVFLHTNVETSYGPVRATNGGFYRYSPQRHQLERTAQISIPNPWGIAFDEWGQNFFLETSNPNFLWMMPGTVKPVYGKSTFKSFNLIEEEHKVRPTSGVEFISSRHFPDDVQGDFLLNNTIGFLGTKQHRISDDGTGYKAKFLQDLLQSSDNNFRPVDLEFAPDGSLYIIDWHNVLIGHMQHSARDPFRDHAHGRIYRITYPSRPLVVPAKIADATIEELFENLKLPEYRTRYRTRRELRGRNASEVLAALDKWVANLDENEPSYDHYILEGLWVSWGLNAVDQKLLLQLLNSENYKARAAAVKVLRYSGHQIKDQEALLMKAAGDDHGRVRLEAMVAASWLDEEKGLAIIQEAGKKPMDKWMNQTYETALAHVQGKAIEEVRFEAEKNNLEGEDLALFIKGKEIYNREGFCITCHQENGKGLSASGFPSLSGVNWVTGDKTRLIKLTLKGLVGPLEANGRKYSGQVPMTPFEGLLDDEELAAVLTFVRNSFGNEASTVSPKEVSEIRKTIKDKTGFYTSEELLNEHPFLEDIQ